MREEEFDRLYEDNRRVYEKLTLYDRITDEEFIDCEENGNWYLYLPLSIDWVYEEYLKHHEQGYR